MSSVKRISAVAAASVLCAGVSLTAASAQAASSYNIMFIGSKIPAGVGSVFVDNKSTPLDSESGCVSNVRPGEDRNTGKAIFNRTDGRWGPDAFLSLHGDSQCQDKGFNEGKEFRLYLSSSNISTKNWWVSLCGVLPNLPCQGQ